MRQIGLFQIQTDVLKNVQESCVYFVHAGVFKVMEKRNILKENRR